MVLLLAILWAFVEKDQLGLFGDKESFQIFINNFGVWGPVIIIGVIVLEVVVAPIPGFVPAISAGFIFGPIWGSVYNYIGNIIGTLIVFFLARRYGKFLVAKFIRKDRLERYCKAITRHENYLLVFYFLPILPIDIITAAFGLSHIKIKKFFLFSSLGFIIYSIIITNFGDYLARIWFF